MSRPPGAGCGRRSLAGSAWLLRGQRVQAEESAAPNRCRYKASSPDSCPCRCCQTPRSLPAPGPRIPAVGTEIPASLLSSRNFLNLPERPKIAAPRYPPHVTPLSSFHCPQLPSVPRKSGQRQLEYDTALSGEADILLPPLFILMQKSLRSCFLRAADDTAENGPPNGNSVKAQPVRSVLVLGTRGCRGPSCAAGLGGTRDWGSVGRVLPAGAGGCEAAPGGTSAGVLLGMHRLIPAGTRSCPNPL